MVEKRRRGRGEGSITQTHGAKWGCPEPVDGARQRHRCRGPWRAMLDLGVIDGKRVRRSAYAESKAEAIRQLDKLKERPV